MKRKKLLRRNPMAQALEQGQYRSKRIASRKLYKRRPRTPSGADLLLLHRVA